MDANIAERLLVETHDFKDAKHLVDVEGMSSARVCNFLNRLVGAMDPDERYLEIGSWKGRTLTSAAFHNQGRVCISCDKFRLWGRYTGWGHVAQKALLSNIERYSAESAEVRQFPMTSRTFFRQRRFEGPVGVYFYDGGHTRQETRHGVREGARLLSKRAVLLVDDWNDAVVRRGAFEGIGDSGLKVLWARHLEGNHDESGFWDGLGVFYVER